MMTGSAPKILSLSRFALVAVAAASLALAAQPALAQHSHASGGHSSAGGGHFGGGGHPSGGSHAPAASSAPSRPAGGMSTAVAHPPSTVTLPRPPASSGTPVAGMTFHNTVAAGNRRENSSAVSTLSSSGLPAGLAPFAEGSSTRSVNSPVTLGFSPAIPTPWQRSSGAGRSVMFSGQGRRLWKIPPQTVTPGAVNPILGSRPGMRVFPRPPHMIFPPQRFPVFFGPSFGFFGNNLFLENELLEEELFGFGFGFGFGNNFGCDPFWGWGCNGFGNGFGFASGSGYGFGPGGYYPMYLSASGSDNSSQSDTAQIYGPYAPENSSADTSASQDSGAAATEPLTLIYLRDGSSYAVSSYWLAGNKLHYVTNYGGENAIDLSLLDLQRTVDENAQRGVSFTLRPAPPANAGSPAQNAPPDSAPPLTPPPGQP
ncbi:MAG TPA: hypothetical protein VJO53_14730 [Candidatus Acidoferrales bacterium]|nr:hypothetical protein [Candidatus Acidoferrales bacterium]